MATAIICDNYIDMNTADANGTALTSTILDNGTQGTPQGTWSIFEAGVSVGSSTHLTIQGSGGSGTDRQSQLYLRDTGTNFAANSTHRRIAYDGVTNVTTVKLTTAGGKFYAVSVSGWLTFGPTDPGAGNGHPFDLVRIDDTGGDWGVLQLWSQDAPNGGGYAVNLHSNPGGVTAYTGHVVVTPGSTCFFSLLFDALNSVTELYLWDSSLVLLDHLIAPTQASVLSQRTIATIQFGNGEVGTTTGITYFENICLDWSKAVSPIGPTGPVNFWRSRASGTGADATATTIATTVTNVAVGDLVVVWAKWEGGAGSNPTCSDGTSSLTRWSLNEINNNGGDPRSCLFYLLSSVASGSVTYTATWGGGLSRTFRDICVLVMTPPAGSTMVLDGTATSKTSVGVAGTSLYSGTQQRSGWNGLTFVGYGAFGSTIGPFNVNGERVNEFVQTTGGSTQSALWCCTYDVPSWAYGAGILSASNQWNAGVISFSGGPVGISVWPLSA